ncbi:hypothetical protein OFAG_02382 [Oxalobacter formigenes HOxBLS]|uniref:Uncharacterized protein n=1 Tax=Oxalobacter paraformigenes TaxID=556268 RepID=T5LQ27_9BURK|nr:hypothetical protein OFAG_02382 [Oxalobacter paraformigenes]
MQSEHKRNSLEFLHRPALFRPKTCGSTVPIPPERSNGYLYAKRFGNFFEARPILAKASYWQLIEKRRLHPRTCLRNALLADKLPQKPGITIKPASAETDTNNSFHSHQDSTHSFFNKGEKLIYFRIFSSFIWICKKGPVSVVPTCFAT